MSEKLRYLRDYTSIKIGGQVREIVAIHDMLQLQAAAENARQSGQKPVILGGGTNILLPDEGLSLVWKMDMNTTDLGVQIQEFCENYPKLPGKNVNNPPILAGIWCGTPIAQIAWGLIRQGISGLEEFTTLPGTLGGAVWGNAHAGDKLIGDLVARVTVLDRGSGRFFQLKPDECQFAYDDSVFKHNPDWVIAEVDLRLGEQEDPQKLTQKATALMTKKRSTQSFDIPSAGCFWQNPENTAALRQKYPEFAGRTHFPAGKLIQEMGYICNKNRPVSVGQHAAYIVNHGPGRASDVLELARQIRTDVEREFGVTLEPEVAIYGENGDRIVL